MLTFLVTAALAQDTSALGSLELYPTIESVGVRVDLSGDDNGDAEISVEFSPAGAGAWQPGHALLPLDGGPTWASSLLYLDSDTAWDVRVTVNDADNGGPASVEASTATRPGAPPPSTGSTIHVDAAAGNDNNDGTPGSPVATIGRGAALAGAGDIVEVAAGVYHEMVVPPNGGAADNPLLLRGLPGAIIDGADEALQAGATWTDEGGGVWSTPFTEQPDYLAADGERIYDYDNLGDLQSEAEGLPGGYYADGGSLYLMLPGGGDPSSTTVSAAVRLNGICLDTLSHVVVEGFEIRHTNHVGIDVRDTSDSWVQDNNIHNVNGGVVMRRVNAHRNVIQRNQISDTSVWDWPWDAVKAHTAERSGISVEDGRGNIVRDNEITGLFNGVYTGQFGPDDWYIAADTDVYRNTMRLIGDDGLEPEGACVNQRFIDNHIHSVHNGVSLAPIETGPVWVVRTVVTDFEAHALKLNNGSTGWMLVYHTTGLVSATLDDAQPAAPSIPFGGLILRNNIFTSHRYGLEYGETSLLGPVSMDYDAWYSDHTAGGGNLFKWFDVRYETIADLAAGTGYEVNGWELEPAFEDLPGEDFALAAGHGLLDVGVVIEGINDVRNIDGPDVGAIERGWVEADTDTDTDADSDTDSDTDADTDARDDTGNDVEGSKGGCGCSTAPGHAGLLVLVTFGIVLRKRQATGP